MLIHCGDHFVKPEIAKFPGGEIRVCIKDKISEDIRIEALLSSADDVLTLMMLTDAARRSGAKHIRLTMPYVPYARQDRVCNPGESLSIKVFADIINSLKFSSVVIYDPHSDVTPALIERCLVVPRKDLMQKHEELYAWICQSAWGNIPLYLVSPDAGSVKKSYEIAKHFPQIRGIVFAEKVRDVATGEITKTVISSQLPDDFGESRLLVCDDVCDGGKTFIELAKVLCEYNPKEMSLYVTHGIFSKGKDILYSYYDNVWSTIEFPVVQK